MHFKDKVAIITGGSSGIGRTVAESFLAEGASVVICSRTKKILKAARQLEDKYKKKQIVPFLGDVSQEKQAKSLVKEAISRFGKIDILVNSAGISEPGKVEKIDLARWNYIIRNNLTNCFLCCKHVLPYMKEKKYGKIINISSIAGRFRSNFAGAHYTSAKAAIIAFTRQLAYEVAGCNINVNVLCPSQTETEMLKKFYLKFIVNVFN